MLFRSFVSDRLSWSPPGWMGLVLGVVVCIHASALVAQLCGCVLVLPQLKTSIFDKCGIVGAKKNRKNVKIFDKMEKSKNRGVT